MIKKLLIITILCSGVGLHSCDTSDPYIGECFIPDRAVNQVVNMSLPEYFKLRNIGEFVYLTGGNRGVFLIHNYDDVFYALERTCPFQSDDECARVELDSSVLRLRCGETVDTGFVECCSSKYTLDGRVLEGPSKCNLKFYQVSQQGDNLFINN